MPTKNQKKVIGRSNSVYKKRVGEEKEWKNNFGTAYNNYATATKNSYKPSNTVTGYRKKSDRALAAAEAMGNFKYNSKYKDNIEGYLQDAADMKFKGNYSLTDDPVYQTYRDEAVHNAQMAARDTMGNAIAQSGGYGSTAAQTASQQSYNEELTKLNDIVPELYQQSFNNQMAVFDEQRSSLMNLAAAYQSLDEQTYNQELGAWQNNFNQYMALAQAYNEKYEYLDAAERREYEVRLDALYNAMTAAQGQYQQQQGLTAAAQEAYANAVKSGDDWDYNQQVLADNKAAREAQERENDKQRAFQAAENAKDRAATSAAATVKSQKKISSGGTKATANTERWIENHNSINNRHVTESGIMNAIKSDYIEGNLTEEEARYLLSYYKNNGSSHYTASYHYGH